MEVKGFYHVRCSVENGIMSLYQNPAKARTYELNTSRFIAAFGLKYEWYPLFIAVCEDKVCYGLVKNVSNDNDRPKKLSVVFGEM